MNETNNSSLSLPNKYHSGQRIGTSWSDSLRSFIQSMEEVTVQFDTVAREFQFIRDHFPMHAHGYPPRKPNRTRKKQRLSRLTRRQKRQQRIK